MVSAETPPQLSNGSIATQLFQDIIEQQSLDHSNLASIISIFGTPQNTIRVTKLLCEQYAGDGIYPYTWDEVRGVLTTWVLLIVSLVVTATFSRPGLKGALSTCSRWFGNPMCSLMYSILDIRATVACARVAKRMRRKHGHRDAEHGCCVPLEDSLSILSALNKFTIDPDLPPAFVGGLVTWSLFQTPHDKAVAGRVRDLRRSLARSIHKEHHRGGIAQAFFSLMLYLTSLIFALQDALTFGSSKRGLDFGIFTSWLLPLVLASVVDWNPSRPEVLRVEINEFFGTCIDIWAHEDHDDPIVMEQLSELAKNTNGKEEAATQLCKTFASQGAVKFHYGLVPSIISAISDRNGFIDAQRVTESLAKGFSLNNVDVRFAACLSYLAVAAAFTGLLVYNVAQPPVGITGVSGSYVILMVLINISFYAEIACWEIGSRRRRSNLPPHPSPSRFQTGLLSDLTSDEEKPGRLGTQEENSGNVNRNRENSENETSNAENPNAEKAEEKNNSSPASDAPTPKPPKTTILAKPKNTPTCDTLHRLRISLLQPLECLNTLCLLCILLARTVGLWESCGCLFVIWIPWGQPAVFEIPIAGGDGSGSLVSAVTLGSTVGTMAVMGMVSGYLVWLWVLRGDLEREGEEHAD